jgi:molecular chaperone IbpA
MEDMAMRNTIDLSAMARSTIGFEHLFDLMENAAEPADSFPHYNIEVIGEDRFVVSLAVAGFGEGELDVTAEPGLLTVTGRKPDAQKPGEYLYRGIALRSFRRQFHLADYVVVRQARLVNGVLAIELQRELPESRKPRRIEIGTSPPADAPAKRAA